MSLSDDLSSISSIFIDTAPIIYYIEAHKQYGPITKEIVDFLQPEKLTAYTSVISLTEVLVKPFEIGNENLAKEFSIFLTNGRNISLIEINASIAESAAKLRGKYYFLKTMDAIQIASALSIPAETFITNDLSLKQIDELNVIVLKDYLP